MAFPEDALGATTEFQIGGVWTDVTEYALTRDVITHRRGRSGEGQAVDPASCSLTLKSPNGLFSPRNPRSPYYGLIGRNTPMRVSVRAGQQRLLLPDESPNARATTPSSSALNIAGALDARVEVALLNWQIGTEVELFGKYMPTGNQRSWQLSISATGGLSLRVSTDGNAVGPSVSTAPVPVPPSGRLALRVTRDNTTGTTTFYTAPSINGTWVQLGTTVTMPTGAIYASTAPLTVGDIEALEYTAPSGSVYAAQLRNGIGGTVVASVDFTTPAIGAPSFVDTTGLTWTLSGGAAISNKRTRFYGEYSDWPPRWSGGGKLITVEGEGAGILRRLNQGKKLLSSTLRRRIPAYNPVAYWPMEEGSEATQAYSPIPGVKVLAASNFAWAADDTLPGSSPLPVVQVGASFVAPVPPTPPGPWQVELVYNLDTMPVAQAVLLEVRTTGTARRVRLRVATGSVQLDGLDADDVQVFNTFVTAPQFTGGWTRLQIKAVPAGTTVVYAIRWIVIGGTGFGATSTITAVPGYVTDVRSSFGTGLDGLRFGHLAVFNRETDAPFNSADQAFNGETAGTRMRRLSGEEGLPILVTGVIADQAQVGPQRPATLLEQVEQAAEADGGILVEDREQLGLRYRGRASEYNQAPALTLSYRSRALTGMEPTDDDMGVRNDVTVTRTGGSSGRAELTSGALSVQDPPAGIGRYDDSIDLNLWSDAQTQPMAYWLMHLGTWDEARYPTITLRLHKAPNLIPAVLDLVEGDMIRITDLPEWLPPGPLDLLVQGWTERIGTRTWEIDLVCAPAGPYRVGVVGDAVQGRVDANPGGTVLQAAAAAGDTTLTVHTPAADAMGPAPWITSLGPSPTYPSEFPLDARLGGEVVRVTANRPWAHDAFNRTVGAGGWGTSTGGQAWSLVGGATSDRSVNGARGVVALPSTPPTVRFQTVPGAVGDCEVRCRVSASAVATGAPLIPSVLLRYVDASTYYRARVHFAPAGEMYVSVARDTTQVGATPQLPYSYTPGDEFEVRVRLTGHLVQIRVWPVGALEPSVWHTSETVVTTPIASGLVGLTASAFAGNTNVSPSLLFDEFVIVTPQAMTVQRAVNGVSKSQAAGAEVRVALPAVVAL
ncbi:hypothetical protein ACIQNU_02260 [Streptomyces sp. NPDC091292]|uniref:hypothetical protein n=1 Tax=Streptomyces sp. NPDC091292 TaxID=3365991 RepID=UPI0037F8756F